jgi:beta-barrel assembly-enhancing protease
MRALLLTLIAAIATVSTLAVADTQHPTGITSANSDLPDLGSPVLEGVTKTEQLQYDQMVAKQLRDEGGLIEDAEVSEYINAVGSKLAAQTPDGARSFHFFVVKDPEINAFALMGGYVFVNYGLILATRSESELAGVMAHEIAHIAQHHILSEMHAQTQQALTSAAAMLATIILGALGGGADTGQAIEGGMMIGQGLAAQQQINFSRDKEAEADRVGIGYLVAAGYNPSALADFFETTSRSEGLSMSYIPAMLVNHPMFPDRIGEARARAAQLSGQVKVKESQSYELIRERLRVITADPDADITKQFIVRLHNGEDTMGVQYGYALALTARGKPEDAVKILTKMTKDHQDLMLPYIALGQAQMKAGHKDEGLATLQKAEDLFPRNVPVTVRYAEGLMSMGRNKDAHLALLDLFNNVEPDPDQIRLTALAASAAGDVGDAYYYMGEYQIAGGELQLAMQQYQLALASPSLTKVQRERITARMNEVRDYLAVARLRRTSNTQGGGQ